MPRVDPAELPEWPEPLIGGKYVRLLQKQLDALRGEDGHGNRKLFLDDVFVVYLLAFFNPAVRSLRTIEDLSQTRQAQKHLSVAKVCKSTLSDFNALSDPQRLEPILTALRTQLARQQAKQPRGNAGDLDELLQKTVAVDGTFLPAAARVAWAVANTNSTSAVRHRARIDTHAELAHHSAVDAHASLLDQLFSGPPRGDAGSGQHLLQAFAAQSTRLSVLH